MNLPEFARVVRRGGVALVLAGMLALSAACGGGGTDSSASPAAGGSPQVSGEVQVTQETAAATEEAGAAAAGAAEVGAAPAVHVDKLTRDPFVNPLTGRSAAPPPATPKPAETAKPGGKPGAAPGGGQKPAAEEVVVKPDIRVTGIMASSGGYRAILTGPESSYIVAAGDKLGAYTVTSVTAKNVTLAFKQHKFTLPLEQETFGAPGGGGDKGAAPKTGQPAPPPGPAPGPGK